MSILKRSDPFRELDRVFEDDFFGFIPAVKRHLEPLMDVYETDNEIVAEMQLAKFDPKNVKVSVHDGILRVEGSIEEEKEEKDKNYLRKEMRSGKFARAIQLPVAVKENEAKASYKNGILKVSIPKAELKQPKEIEVQVQE